MSDSSSQLIKDASSASQDAARPTELRVCRACTESPVGAGAEARTDHHKDILSIVNTDWGFMRAVIQVNVYHCPPLMPHTGTLCNLHIKCAGDL